MSDSGRRRRSADGPRTEVFRFLDGAGLGQRQVDSLVAFLEGGDLAFLEGGQQAFLEVPETKIQEET